MTVSVIDDELIEEGLFTVGLKLLYFLSFP